MASSSPSSSESGPQLDSKQEAVFQCIQSGHNCTVRANPGTGKTTSILVTAKRIPDKRFLIITYNNSLQTSTADDIQSMGLDNVEVFTYHQFLHQKYDPTICDDCGLINYLVRDRLFRLRPAYLPLHLLLQNVQPLQSLPVAGASIHYDVVVVDEVQDMGRLYFFVVLLAMIDNACPLFQLALMGDTRQGVYEYRGADRRFLTLAAKLFQGCKRLLHREQWHDIRFDLTHRLTQSVCDFVNNAMRHKPSENTPLLSSDDPATSVRNHAVTVFIDEANECLRMTLGIIEQILHKRPNCPLEQIVVCCNSLKDAFVKRVMQLLTLNGFPIFVPSSMEGASDASMFKGRIRFYTRHSIKGLTCDYLLNLNLNNSFFTLQRYMNPLVSDAELLPGITPAPHFVSLTRARILLVIVNVFSPHEKTRKLDQMLPPYFRRSVWEDALEGKIPKLRIHGQHAKFCVASSELHEAASPSPSPAPAPGQQESSPSSSPLSTPRQRKFYDVTQLCAFLSSDFVANELSDIHSWFDKDSLSVVAGGSSSNNGPRELGLLGEDDGDAAGSSAEDDHFREMTEEDMPSRVENVYGQIEDVSDLTGKAMAYFGYDYLRSREHPSKRKRSRSSAFGGGGEFMAENGGLDATLRKLSLDHTVVGGDFHQSTFGDAKNRKKHFELRKRFEYVRENPRGSIRDYLHAVAVLEAVKSGMYHRVLHFREEDMTWIPDCAVDSCRMVIDRFVPFAEDEEGFLCEHFLSTNIRDAAPNIDVTLRGQVDLISHRFLFEWKYKSSLQLEDMLQVLIYYFLYAKCKGQAAADAKTIALLNLRTGTRYALKSQFRERAMQMVEKLLFFKLTNQFKEQEQKEEGAEAVPTAREYQESEDAFIQTNQISELVDNVFRLPAGAATAAAILHRDL